MSFDFALETKLMSESPGLHEIFVNNVACCQNILIKYKAVFPTFTDHTSLHSLEVIAFCNELVGNNIDRLNCDEIFVLLMAAYLHDTGMGITPDDYDRFAPQMPMVQEYINKNPDAPIDEVIRRYHNEFSGKFIEKYRMVFDFPSEAHMFAVIQASRGHRKTELYDESQYPAELRLENGNVIHLPYLSALIRITDELDIAADRNIQFMYDIGSMEREQDIIAFGKHLAIKEVNCLEDRIEARVDFSDEKLRPYLMDDFSKLQETLSQCVNVSRDRSPFEITQKSFDAYDINSGELIFSGCKS